MKQKIQGPSVIEVRDVPAVDKGPLVPVEFVKHWVAVFGNFKDGKIEESCVMQYEDLTVEDTKYLLQAGITVAQIAKQYSIDEFTLTKRFIKDGLLATPVSDSAEEDAVVYGTFN